MILEYDDVIGENTLLSKPVAVTLYLLNFIVFTSDKPIKLICVIKNVVSYFVKCEV